MKISYNLNYKSYFQWRQIVNSISKTWKKVPNINQNDSSSLVLLDHQLLKNNCTLMIEKMTSKDIHSRPITISSKVNMPTSRIHFEKIMSSL